MSCLCFAAFQKQLRCFRIINFHPRKACRWLFMSWLCCPGEWLVWRGSFGVTRWPFQGVCVIVATRRLVVCSSSRIQRAQSPDSRRHCWAKTWKAADVYCCLLRARQLAVRFLVVHFMGCLFLPSKAGDAVSRLPIAIAGPGDAHLWS